MKRIRDAVGDTPAYLSIDIDGIHFLRICLTHNADLALVLDPSIAPATGTPESGGWTTRELKRLIHGLKGLNLVGADVVEVSPPYDTNAETTSIAAADILVDILALMTGDKKGLKVERKAVGKDEL